MRLEGLPALGLAFGHLRAQQRPLRGMSPACTPRRGFILCHRHKMLHRTQLARDAFYTLDMRGGHDVGSG
jgi:hypothetical protein